MDVTEHENKIPLGFTTECSKSSIYDYLVSLKYVAFYWLNGYNRKSPMSVELPNKNVCWILSRPSVHLALTWVGKWLGRHDKTSTAQRVLLQVPCAKFNLSSRTALFPLRPGCHGLHNCGYQPEVNKKFDFVFIVFPVRWTLPLICLLN